MRIIQTTLVTLFFLFQTDLFSQQQLAPPMVFGKISGEDLKMTVYERDTSATALVLCNYGQANVEQSPDKMWLRWEHHKRIKILKKQGFGYGDIAILFYSYQKREEFFFDKAEIHLPNGNKVKLNKKDVFIEKMNDRWSVARFTFPQLEEGSIIEYSYFINSEYIQELREWYFQEDIPVVWSELRINFPRYYHYVYLFQGNEGMQKTLEHDGVSVYSGKNGTCRLSNNRFIMENAPALKPEGYLTTMSDYLARIQFQLSEVHYPDGRVEKVMNSWKEFQTDLDHASVFGEQLLKKSSYKKLAEAVLPLAESLTGETAKTRFFYDYLVRNLQWNGNHSVFTRPQKLEDIFENKEANSGEMNMMLYVLLREAGITAYPVLISTRSHGKMYEDYPILDQFNHLMVLAMPDGERMLLDATDPLRPPGYPDIDGLNSRGLMLKPGGGTPSWMNITPPKDGADILIWELALGEDGTLSGLLKGTYKGYNAMPERRYYRANTSGEHWKKRLSETFPDVVVDSIRYGNLEKVEEAFFDTVHLQIPGAAQVSGDFIYLPPVLYSSFDENPFKQPERNYPVDVPYPLLEQHIAKIALPPGYKVEDLPEAANYLLPANGGSFRFVAEQKEPGFLNLMIRLQINQLKFSPTEYPGVKELFDLAVEKFGEQIVLKKE